jgi:hypothetical protein
LLLVKKYQYIRILFELSTKLLSNRYDLVLYRTFVLSASSSTTASTSRDLPGSFRGPPGLSCDRPDIYLINQTLRNEGWGALRA